MLVYNIIKSVALPPGSFILLLLLAVFLWYKKNNWAFWLVLVTALGLWILSTPIVPVSLAKPLAQDQALTAANIRQPQAQAIIVLSGGEYPNAPEFNGHNVRDNTLQRLYYAAALYQQTHLPLLLSGSDPDNWGTPQAQLMATAAHKIFVIPQNKIWMENNSINTKENAAYCAIILKQKKISKAYLVTDAIHMQRAKKAFAQYKIQIIPAPTGFYTQDYKISSALDWLPNISAFYRSTSCIYEYLGNFWYTIAH